MDLRAQRLALRLFLLAAAQLQVACSFRGLRHLGGLPVAGVRRGFGLELPGLLLAGLLGLPFADQAGSDQLIAQ